MNTEVILMHGARMSESAFDAERQRIRDTYGDNAADAGARFEQAIAILYTNSHWTEDELAAKEHKKRSYIEHKLRYGRFLSQTSNYTGPIVNEKQFWKVWKETSSISNERERFSECLSIIEEAVKARPGQTVNNIGKAIREHYMDGKWHTPDTIARHIAKPVEEVEKTLSLMSGRVSNKWKIEKERRGSGYRYRLFPTEHTVSMVELTEKFGPLIEELKLEGRKNAATIAISRIAAIASQMASLMNEWSE